jgi:hypothetical protein
MLGELEGWECWDAGKAGMTGCQGLDEVVALVPTPFSQHSCPKPTSNQKAFYRGKLWAVPADNPWTGSHTIV